MPSPSSADRHTRRLSSDSHPRRLSHPDSAFQTAHVKLPQEVIDMLTAVLPSMHEALGDNLMGVYLRGSLAMGDFDPVTSDLDFFAVTERPVSEAAFTVLVAVHARLDVLPNHYAGQLEGPYIDRSAARRFRPGERYPTIGRGEALAWHEHGYNWVLERWMVREHGITVLGPNPKTLIDPVASNELRTAARLRMRTAANTGRSYQCVSARKPSSMATRMTSIILSSRLLAICSCPRPTMDQCASGISLSVGNWKA